MANGQFNEKRGHSLQLRSFQQRRAIISGMFNMRVGDGRVAPKKRHRRGKGFHVIRQGD